MPCQHSPADSRLGTLCYGAKSRVISLAGFFVAGYTGALRVSGGSTGAAVIALVMAWRKMTSNVSFEQLEAFDRVAMIGELVLIVLLIIAAGRFAAPLLSGPYALTFWGGTVVLGILVPLALNWYARRPGMARGQ